MIPALRHIQRLRIALAADAIDQSVFAADPAGPPARKVAAQRFGLAGALERVAAAFGDQGIQLCEHFGIVGLPVEILIPSAG